MRRLVRDEGGSTIVEFALVATPLIVLLMGGLDLAYQSYVQAVMQGALNDAARKASVEDPTFIASGDTLEERVENTIKSQVGHVAKKATFTVTTTSFFDFSGIGNPEKLTTDQNGNGQFDEADGDCWEDLNENGEYDTDTGRDGRGGASDVVFYEATLSMDRLLPLDAFTGVSPTYNMKMQTAVRNQPWSTQEAPPVLCAEPA